jgi:hypothetical protein
VEGQEKFDGVTGKVWWRERKSLVEGEEKFGGGQEKFDGVTGKV